MAYQGTLLLYLREAAAAIDRCLLAGLGKQALPIASCLVFVQLYNAVSQHSNRGRKSPGAVGLGVMRAKIQFPGRFCRPLHQIRRYGRGMLNHLPTPQSILSIVTRARAARFAPGAIYDA